MDGDGFWAAPFPRDDRRHADGTVDISALFNPSQNAFVGTVAGLIDGTADGFGRTSAIGMTLTGDADLQALPDVWSSVDPVSPILLVDVDPASPERGALIPVDVSYDPVGGPYGAPRMLSILPLQGRPLRIHTRYAAIVKRDLAAGDGLGVSLEMAQLAHGDVPDAMSVDLATEFHDAIASVADLGIDGADIAGMTVFTTGDPQASLRALLADAISRKKPIDAAFQKTDTFDGYCVYHTTIPIPTYQQGTPPFLSEGGGIAFDGASPVYVRDDTAAFWLTVPRGPAPTGGWPTIVMIETGGGGDRPLVDRGVHATRHGEPTAPGEGPAMTFAQAGFAAIQIDPPHEGLRNPTGGDAQLLMFNMGNPTAMLDNFREAAVEVALHADVLDGLVVDTSDCDGAPATSTFDMGHLALFGHSMGATIAPTAAAIEPRYRALVLSGAGGSWLANVVYKQNPLNVRPVAETIIGYTAIGRPLTETDPALSLVQWAGEATDPPVHAPELRDRDVLMFQGIVDTYILPPIANPLSLALHVDLAGDELSDPRLDTMRTWSSLAPLVGTAPISLPASGNDGGHTRVLVQHREDGIEDGHEVVFQTQEPKEQYRCFLRDYAGDQPPTVPSGTCD